MPIPILSQESPNLAIVDWCLIATQEVSIVWQAVCFKNNFLQTYNKNSISEPHVLFLTISERHVTISEPQVIAITEPEVLLPNLTFYFRNSHSNSELEVLLLNLTF